MIRVVLVGPREAANVGMVARAMKNFGLKELVLVAPEIRDMSEAYRLSSRAHDVLERARIVPTLDEAIADCVLVAGTTARRRERYAGLAATPRAAAGLIRAAAARGPVALLFGRENFGLFNEELDRCHYVLHIPTAPDYASLNLAQAVLLVAYELFQSQAGALPETDPAPAASLEAYFRDLEAYLIEIGYTDPPRLPSVMRHFRRMAHKALLTEEEVRMLRGLLRQSRWAMGRRRD